MNRPYRPSLYDPNRLNNQWYDPRANNGFQNPFHSRLSNRSAHNSGYGWRRRNPEGYEDLLSEYRQMVDEFVEDFFARLPDLLRKIADDQDEYEIMLDLVEEGHAKLTQDKRVEGLQMIVGELRNQGYTNDQIFVMAAPVSSRAEVIDVPFVETAPSYAPSVGEPPPIPTDLLSQLDQVQREQLNFAVEVLPTIIAEMHQEGLI